MTSKKVYLFSLTAILLASVYPIYMGIIMLMAYIQHGGIDAAAYPRYVIPYTPICAALIICTGILPVIYKICKKFALVIISAFSTIIFLIVERFFERIVVFSSIFETRNIKWWENNVETGNGFRVYLPRNKWKQRKKRWK